MNPLHLTIAVGVFLVVALAERLHARRIARVAHLAFGTSGQPRSWTSAVGPIRAAAAGIAAWGLLFLATFEPVEVDKAPAKIASNHLLVLLDVSPSMQIQDAGPEAVKISRAKRAGDVVRGILDRLDMEKTRITLVAFYTKALPILVDTFDKEVIHNALDGLPMYVAFDSGHTDLQQGIAKGFEIARVWPAESGTLLIITDGDVTASMPSAVPSSIADTIVIGLGDSSKATSINGHSSRQDSMGLRQLALRLGGTYHDGNRKHLPSDLIASLNMITPRAGGQWSNRDLALAGAGIGCFSLGIVGILLQYFGRSGAPSRQRTTKESFA